MIYSDYLAMSPKKSLSDLALSACVILRTYRAHFDMKHLLAFRETDCRDHGREVWPARRDEPYRLNLLEKLAYFFSSSSIFLTPSGTIVTLDVDFYGSR